MYFKEQIKKRMKNEKGLTLVELLAVIVILGIIAAIAIPSIGNIIANSRAKAVISDAQNVMNAAQLYFVDNPEKSTFTNTVAAGNDTTSSQADFNEFVESKGKLKDVTVTKASPNTIAFSLADDAGIKITTAIPENTVTLELLNKAEVKKGIIKIPATAPIYIGGSGTDFGDK